MYDVMEAIGAHEIVVESPEHHQTLATMDPRQIEKILLAYKGRLIDLEKDQRFQQFLILKNHPGIFNRHPHSHLMAMPVIPKRIDEEIWGTLDYYQRKERCIFCDIIKEEISMKKRVILETVHFLIFSHSPRATRLKRGSFRRSTALIFTTSPKQRWRIFPSESNRCSMAFLNSLRIRRIV